MGANYQLEGTLHLLTMHYSKQNWQRHKSHHAQLLARQFKIFFRNISMPTLLASLKTSNFSNLSLIVKTLLSLKHKSTIFSPKVSNKSIWPFLRIDLILFTMCSYETKFSILCSIPEILSLTSRDKDIEIFCFFFF